MTDIHAAVLRANIGQLAHVNARRSENAARLSEGLGNIEGLVVPRIQANRSHVWHQYTVRVQEAFGMNRDELKAALDQRGIGSGIYYPKTMTDHPTFENHPHVIIEPTPVARRVVQEVLSLPVHPGLDEADIDRIIETINDIYKGK